MDEPEKPVAVIVRMKRERREWLKHRAIDENTTVGGLVVKALDARYGNDPAYRATA